MNLFELFAKISLDSTGFEAALAAAEKGLVAATAAVTAFAGASVKVGEQFDKSMSQVAATMGYTVDQLNDSTSEEAKNFQKLRDFAQEMGATTAFSASQAADALNYMALAGYDAETSIQMLPNVLNLAASGSIELARASDMITDAQSALGLSLEDTNKLVDQMARTASKSNTSVSQLGDAILTIGGTADIMAGGTERLNTVLGLLADNGIKGSEAGTHLRNMILKLASPTNDGAKAMEALGLKVFDAEGRMRDFEDIIGDLNEAFDPLSDEEKINYISDLFNARDISAVNALLNTSKKRWAELAGTIDDSEGAAQAMAETQLDNLAGDVTLFKSALEGAQIVMSDQLTPTLREFVQFGASAISRVAEGFKEGDLSGAMEAFGQILSEGLSMAIEAAPGIVDAAAKLLSTFTQGLVDNLPLLTQSLIDILMILGEQLIQDLPVFVTSIVEAISQIALLLTDPETLGLLLESLMTIITVLAQSLIENVPTLIDTTLQVIDNIIQFVMNNLPMFVETAVQIILALMNGLIQALPTLLAYLPTIIQRICDTLLYMLPVIIQAGVTLLTALINDLPNIITQIVAVLPQIIDSIVTTLTTMIPQIVDAGVTILVALVENMPEILSQIAGSLPAIISRIIKKLTDMIPMIVNAGIKLFVALIENLPQAIATIVEHLPEIISAIVEGLGGMLSSMWDVGKNIVEGLWTGISNAADWLWQKVSGWVSGLIDGVLGWLGIHSPSTVFADMGKNIDLGLAKGIEKYADVATDATEDMMGDVLDAANKDLDFTGTVSGKGLAGALAANRGSVINVYGAEGQDVNELAEIISQKIAFGYAQEQAVWA